jgi:[acyl-carrier-protein] S-malonyltransferase
LTLAILCSGQGHQGPSMFAETGDAPSAAELFSRAAPLLGGRDPRALVRSESDDVLHQNRTGQILCTLQALAAHASLASVWPRRLVVAGYSVGEVAAWSIAGLIEATATLDLVARRAEVMDGASAADDGLLFVRGLPRDAVDELCRRHGAAVAIVNPGDAFVLGASGTALDTLAEEARGRGASRVVRVAVKVASHTPRLSSASTAFRDILDRAPLASSLAPGVRLLSGIDGSAVFDIRSGADKLAAQISHTVQWAACLDACVEAGAVAFLELGPGRALAEMAGADSGLPARSLDDFKALEGVRDWLRRVSE